MHRFEHSAEFAAPVQELFAWHERPGALERLLPPWRPLRIVSRGGIREGDTASFELAAGPLRIPLLVAYRDYAAGRSFASEQVSGPFAHWRHERVFRAADAAGKRLGARSEPQASVVGSVLDERIDWSLPTAAAWLPSGGIERALARDAAFRERRLHDDLARHARVGAKPQRIAITGASGLIGRALADFLSSGGHRVLRVVRRATSRSDEIPWDPARGVLEARALEGLDALVHLAGESIAGARWTEQRKRRIRESRVQGTRLLADRLARLSRPPRVWLSASALGFYGERGDAALDESSAPGSDFLAGVCREWEAAAAPAAGAGIRVVHPRIGVVLSARGGALAPMLLQFRAGLGGPVGNGAQYLSWISLDDTVGALHHLLFAEQVEGPVNLAAPAPLPSREFAAVLGRVLRRPARLALPAGAVSLLLGEMGRALLLGSARLVPARLRDSGFRWLHPQLEGALRAELGLAR
jgi:uncharacterized protein